MKNNNSSAVIEVNKLTKTFTSGKEPFHALQDVTFTINKGDTVAIIGKSGSGKSTLMHQLALLDTPSSGELKLDGRLVNNLSTKTVDLMRNQKYGFVFQQFFLNGKDTVLNNVILPLKVAGISGRERTNKAMAALEAVELTDKVNNRANDLSGGQKQRVCIARALVNEPEVLFADEPTGNLDSKTGDKVVKLLFDLNKEKNITLIVVTHDPDLAKLCSRQLVLKDGRLIEEK